MTPGRFKAACATGDLARGFPGVLGLPECVVWIGQSYAPLSTLLILLCNRFFNSFGVSQSMQLYCLTSKCSFFIWSFLHVNITGRPLPIALARLKVNAAAMTCKVRNQKCRAINFRDHLCIDFVELADWPGSATAAASAGGGCQPPIPNGLDELVAVLRDHRTRPEDGRPKLRPSAESG